MPEVSLAAPTALTRNRLFRKTILCRYYKMGKCKHGQSCNFAHSKSDLRPQPDFHRTKFCKTLVETGDCKDPECRFAHDRDELRKLTMNASGPQSGKCHVDSRRTAASAKTTTKPRQPLVHHADEDACNRHSCNADQPGYFDMPHTPSNTLFQMAKEPSRHFEASPDSLHDAQSWVPVIVHIGQSALSLSGPLALCRPQCFLIPCGSQQTGSTWLATKQDAGEKAFVSSCGRAPCTEPCKCADWSRQSTIEPSLEEDALEEFDKSDGATNWRLESADDDSLDSLHVSGADSDGFTQKPEESIATPIQTVHWPVQEDVSVKNTFIHIDEPIAGVLRKVLSEGDLSRQGCSGYEMWGEAD